jgi:hypothetical protein
LISTTVRLDEDDVRALRRARADGLSASELGESEVFKDLEE